MGNFSNALVGVSVGVFIWAVVYFIMVKLKRESPIMWLTTLPLFVLVFLGFSHIYDVYLFDSQYEKHITQMMKDYREVLK